MADQQTSVYPEKKQAPFATTDYYAPLRTVQMEAEMEDSNNPDSEEQQITSRMPLIALTSATSLIKLPVKLKRNLRILKHTQWNSVLTQHTVDYSANRADFEFHCTFYHKSDKSMKAVTCHMPADQLTTSPTV
jgi:hypothetical protein